MFDNALKKGACCLLYKVRGDTRQYFRELEQSQWASEEAALGLQRTRLTAILKHAFANVPYYKKLFIQKGGFDNLEKFNLEMFNSIPLLEKKTVRDNFEDLKSKDLSARKWYLNTSGGSTGEPVKFIQDKYYSSWKLAIKNLYDDWTGYSVGNKRALLWGSERDLFIGRETAKVRIGRYIRNELWLNAFSMKPAEMKEFVLRINRFRPVQILAYAQSIYDLANYVKNEGLEVHSPQAIMTSAGTLYGHMRKTIEEIFGAPVFNRYGSREVGDIGCECEKHEGLHVPPAAHYIEIIKPDGTPAAPGQSGEVVVTSLINYAMPLIRYRIGDMAAWAEAPCSCGRSWPLLKEVTGRVSDSFVGPDRTSVHGEFFTHLFYFKDWVEKFQVVQEGLSHIVVYVVIKKLSCGKNELFSEQEDIKEKIRKVMGTDCRVDFKYVEDIKPSTSGKYRYTISKIH